MKHRRSQVSPEMVPCPSGHPMRRRLTHAPEHAASTSSVCDGGGAGVRGSTLTGPHAATLARSKRRGRVVRMGRLVDLTGDRFGKLVALRRVPMPAHVKRRPIAFWEVQCDCGSPSFATRSDALRAGRTTSCGCVRGASNVTHGRSRDPIYRCWMQMIQRCHNPNDAWYRNYGARGIKVCERWRGSFEAFLASVGERPSPKHTLDRIDNSRGYEPDNVRWATRTEQMNNIRNNVLVEHNGECHSIAEWSRIVGIPSSTLQARLSRGVPPDVAMSLLDLRRSRHDVTIADKVA